MELISNALCDFYAFICAFLSAEWVNENRIVIAGTVLVEIELTHKTSSVKLKFCHKKFCVFLK